MSKKQSSVEWLYSKMYEHRGNITVEEFEQAKAMHKEEMKMIIEHYHNKLFYLELTEIELENITKMIYKETFGGQE
jgi:hypothetical protein